MSDEQSAAKEFEQRVEESLAKVGARNAGQVFADTYNSHAPQLPSLLQNLGKKSLIRLLMSVVKVNVSPEDFKGLTAEKERVVYGILERVIHAKHGWMLFTELANAEEAAANINNENEGENVRKEKTET